MLRDKASTLTQTLWGTGIASVLLLPSLAQTTLLSIKNNLLILVLLGVISLGLASFLYFTALKKLSAQIVSNVAILEPVCGVIIGIIAFNEIPNLYGILGIVLILFSIILITR